MVETAIYPVLIDPTIVNPTIPMSLVDTYVLQSSPSSNYHNSYLMSIGGGSGSEARGLMKFNLPTLLNDQVITYAHVEFIRTALTQNSFQVNIFKNTSDFNVTTVTWANGRPAYNTLLSMNYNGDEYFYIKNLQGDIIEIVDASGYAVARYRYDTWGNNIIDPWDSGLGIANINPHRYRSYRLDLETGLYYLNARYYDPSIGRFISADSINYLDPSSEQGLNLYAYGNNNPVMYMDNTGNFHS